MTDVHPGSKQSALKILSNIKSTDTYDKNDNLMLILSKVMYSTKNGTTPAIVREAEVRINCHMYKARKRGRIANRVKVGVKITDVDKSCVMERVAGLVKSVANAADILMVLALLFSYK